jgi:hypothetical protein
MSLLPATSHTNPTTPFWVSTSKPVARSITGSTSTVSGPISTSGTVIQSSTFTPAVSGTLVVTSTVTFKRTTAGTGQKRYTASTLVMNGAVQTGFIGESITLEAIANTQQSVSTNLACNLTGGTTYTISQNAITDDTNNPTGYGSWSVLYFPS